MAYWETRPCKRCAGSGECFAQKIGKGKQGPLAEGTWITCPDCDGKGERKYLVMDDD